MIKRFLLMQTFVAVARTGKMRDAADLLAVTPGAVSMRVKQLESEAGQALFTRVRSGVELNEAGTELFASLEGPFRDIEAVERRLDLVATRRRIVISTMQSFAATWLVPRLERFSRLHPDVEVVVETSNALVDLRRDPVDLAVRHGLGRYPGLESTWLMAPELIVVGSPSLLAARPPIEEPADCLNYPLLHGPRRKDWPTWFEALGVPAPNATAGHAFSDRQLIVAAAVAGQGLALAHDVDARAALRSGQLVRPLTTSWPAEIAYYAVTTPEASGKPVVRRFRDWLVDEARRDPEGPQ